MDTMDTLDSKTPKTSKISPKQPKMQIPTVPCFPRIDTPGWQFLCPYCLVWHFHGRGLGHRVAHCAKETPYSQIGYVLESAVPRKAKEGFE